MPPQHSHFAIAMQAAAAEDSSPRYTVQLLKPLGIVLEEDAKTKVISVSEVKPDSAAEKQNVRVGDILLATSGVTYNRIEDYAGVSVSAGQEVVRMAVKGETLKTVSAAIRSHPGHMAVTLEFQRG
jgi:S1-C subfamily serine protease